MNNIFRHQCMQLGVRTARLQLTFTFVIACLFGVALFGRIPALKAALERSSPTLATAAGLSLIANTGLQQPPVVTVSAASFEATAIAPDSIVAAFGTRLATTTIVAMGDADPNTPGIQLPTELGGTTVEVNGRRAGLFFVSPMQVNYLVPANTESGAVNVVVRAGDGAVSNGTMQVRAVAPAIFTANSDGKGVPAAVLLRVKATGQQTLESLFQCAGSPAVCSTMPIDLGPEGERVFLILFFTGIRRADDPNRDGNLNENVHVVIGGNEVTPLFAGSQGVFAGLDQMNAEIPRSLIGRGRVSLAVAGNGFAASNLCDIEIGAPAGSAPPMVSGFSPATVLAGQKLTINGSGFSANPAEMLARFAGIEGRIEPPASSNQLMVTAPFGARSGAVTVRTPMGEGTSANPLSIRTSISGIIETTNRQPLAGVTVKLAGTNLTARTGAEGIFILPDVTVGPAVVEVDGATVPTTPPFSRMLFRMIVSAGQDNQFARPLSLQQPTGPGLVVGPSSLTKTAVSVPAPSDEFETEAALQTGEIRIELPSNATFRFPDGAARGTLTLTKVNNSRTPVNLPLGLFSSAIAQITPFGASISPGCRLIFPNPEGYAAGSKVRLFRLDQTANSITLGSFVEAGMATVSSDGQRIETDADAVKETSSYFVASPQQSTTVIGRVVDSDNTTPVRLALVRARGQEAFTDGNGAFILRHVPVRPANDQISVEASFVRPNGRVDRVQSGNIAIVVDGITKVISDLVLPSEASNRPPVIICPPNLTASAGQTLDINFSAYDPDPGQTIQVAVSGEAFASVIKGNNDSYTLRLTLRAGLTGTYTLSLKATDNQGASTTCDIPLRVAPTVISCGQTRRGQLVSVVQRDTYTFSGRTNDTVIITAKALTTFCDVCPCMVAEVYGPTGTLVKTISCNTRSIFPLPSDGMYTIVIYESGFDRTDFYDLNLQFADGRCGTVIGYGQTRRGTLSSIIQHDIWKFSGKANDMVILTAKALTTFCDVCPCMVAEVYGPTGTLVRQNACNTEGKFTLPSDGMYTIVIYESGFDRTDSYDINLTCIGPTCSSVLNSVQPLNRPSPNSTGIDGAAHSNAANTIRSRRRIR